MPQPSTTAIAEIVVRLLNHFGTVDEPVAVRKAIARDWIEDLAEFSARQVDDACREWRRTKSHRPTISDIRSMCITAQNQERSRKALAEQARGALDAETIAMWKQPEFDGDSRSWQQRRNDAIARNEEGFVRGAEYRKEQWRAQFAKDLAAAAE
jgi:hypothetical protein